MSSYSCAGLMIAITPIRTSTCFMLRSAFVILLLCSTAVAVFIFRHRYASIFFGITCTMHYYRLRISLNH